jgi:hypothetical protein
MSYRKNELVFLNAAMQNQIIVVRNSINSMSKNFLLVVKKRLEKKQNRGEMLQIINDAINNLYVAEPIEMHVHNVPIVSKPECSSGIMNYASGPMGDFLQARARYLGLR